MSPLTTTTFSPWRGGEYVRAQSDRVTPALLGADQKQDPCDKGGLVKTARLTRLDRLFLLYIPYSRRTGTIEKNTA